MKIEPLAARHERAAFRCGVLSIDKYLRAQAAKDCAKALSAVFVGVLPDGKVAGYYALSAATVLLPDLLGSSPRAISRYPAISAARLTRLAVDKRHRGQGHAKALLTDAIARLQAGPMAPTALIAEAQNEAAQRFFNHAGFSLFADQPNRAFRVLRG